MENGTTSSASLEAKIKTTSLLFLREDFCSTETESKICNIVYDKVCSSSNIDQVRAIWKQRETMKVLYWKSLEKCIQGKNLNIWGLIWSIFSPGLFDEGTLYYWLFINYIIFFKGVQEFKTPTPPYPTSHLVSTFGLPPPNVIACIF